jgi:preprotein translocase subunit YajC
MLEETIMKMAMQNASDGIFLILFVWLLFHVMRNNKERESKLQELLDKFSSKYDLIVDELKEIKGKL